MTAKKKQPRQTWVEALMNKIERINAADTAYHVQVGNMEIIVRHGKNEIGYADNGYDAEYVLNGIIRRIENIEAANK